MSKQSQKDAEQQQIPQYKLFSQHSRQILNTFNANYTILNELTQIPIAPHPPIDLVAANCVQSAIQTAVYNSVAIPSQPLPISVAIPSLVHANDAEYTGVIATTCDKINAFETTRIIQKYDFNIQADDSEYKDAVLQMTYKYDTKPVQTKVQQKTPSSKITSHDQKKEQKQEYPTVFGACELKKYNRPPSAVEVRQINKEIIQKETQRAAEKIDPKQFKQQKLKQMQVILAAESKNGRKMTELPDNMKYVVNEAGNIVGVSSTLPKPLTDIINTDSKIRRDDDKDQKKTKKDEEYTQIQKQQKVNSDMNKKYQESLFGPDYTKRFRK